MKKQQTVMNRSCLVLAGAAFAACMVLAAEGAGSQSGTNDAIEGSVTEKRDPFWPVGYMPKHVKQAQVKAAVKSTGGSWKEAMKKVVINGVSSSADDEVYAVINGELKSVGDTVSVRLGTSVYTWAVDAIVPPAGVKLRRVLVR